VVQSYSRHDSYDTREYKTHAVFSSAKDANEAARRIFNKEGDLYGSITKADLAKSAKAGNLTVHDDRNEIPIEVTFDGSVSVTVDIGDEVGDGEQLKGWVTAFGMDEGMPMEK